MAVPPAHILPIIVLVVLTVFGQLGFCQIQIESLYAVETNYSWTVGASGNISCRCIPENAQYNIIWWIFSETGNYSASEPVYSYTSPTSGNSDGRLTGRAFHSHADGLLTLHILNTKLDDHGTYFCDFRGTVQLVNQTGVEVISDENGKTFTPQMNNSIERGSDFTATVESNCSRPEVRFEWSPQAEAPDNTISSEGCPRDARRSRSVYRRLSVMTNFTLVLTVKHVSLGSAGKVFPYLVAVFDPPTTGGNLNTFSETNQPPTSTPPVCQDQISDGGKKAGLAIGSIGIVVAAALLIFCGYRKSTGSEVQVPVLAAGVFLCVGGVILVIVFAVLRTCP